MNFKWHLRFLLNCYLNVTCLVVRVNSISNMTVDVWFFFTSYTTCQFLNCACQLMCIFFYASFYVSNIKHWGQHYLLELNNYFLITMKEEQHAEGMHVLFKYIFSTTPYLICVQGSKNKYHKDMCLKEIGLCLQILCSIELS